MRVVLDSSVLIAAVLARAGVCAALLEDVLGAHQLVLSPFILAEVERILADKFQLPKGEIHAYAEILRREAEWVEPMVLDLEICRDVNDLPVLGTAIAGRAAALVTVDKDLLSVEMKWGGVICRPGEFWGLD